MAMLMMTLHGSLASKFRLRKCDKEVETVEYTLLILSQMIAMRSYWLRILVHPLDMIVDVSNHPGWW